MAHALSRQLEVRGIAPDAFEAFEQVMVSARASIDAGLYALVARRIAMLLGVADEAPADEKLRALPKWPTSPLFSERDRACLAFAEQFALDVSSVTPEQRAALASALGAGAAAFGQTLYAIDFELRLRSAFGTLFRADPLAHEPDAAPAPLWPALEAMMPVIARRTALDPLTTELVRLRGARVHQCRVCKSLRNVRALAQGGGESTFEKVDAYEQSDLAERHKAALRLVDAVLFRCSDFPTGLGEELRAHWSDEQIVEILLDVTRNALNKFAVAMGVDGVGVGEGIGYYDTDERGEMVYGLAP